MFPFILRGVAVLGIDSVQAPMGRRRKVWQRLAGDLRPAGLLDLIARELALEEVDAFLDDVLADARWFASRAELGSPTRRARQGVTAIPSACGTSAWLRTTTSASSTGAPAAPAPGSSNTPA